MTDWSYEAWPSGEPYSWHGTNRGPSPWDNIDFHVDLGCGKVKKGRIGVDRYAAEGVNVVMDLDKLEVYSTAREPGAMVLDEGGFTDESCLQVAVESYGLPFHDSSIVSIISHHALEHIGDGFIPLMDEIYRVLKPNGILRVIVPLFPSWSAVTDPDHKRWFLADEEQSTFDAFCGTPDNHFCESFSVPYTQARFEKVDQDITPRLPNPGLWWTHADARELRIALKANK